MIYKYDTFQLTPIEFPSGLTILLIKGMSTVCCQSRDVIVENGFFSIDPAAPDNNLARRLGVMLHCGKYKHAFEVLTPDGKPFPVPTEVDDKTLNEMGDEIRPRYGVCVLNDEPPVCCGQKSTAGSSSPS